MAEQNGGQDERPGGLARWSRVTSFWALVLLLSLAALSVRRGGQQAPTELDYSEFVRQISSENILRLTVNRETGNIEGELRRPITKDGQEFTDFETTLTGDLTEHEDALLGQGTEIKSESDSGAWWTLLVGILPWVIFAAFWLWILRTMQSGGNRAFQFGRSKAKLISPDTPQLTFQDVGRCRRSQRGARGDHRVPEGPRPVFAVGGTPPQGRAVGGPTGNREDAPGQGRGG